MQKEPDRHSRRKSTCDLEMLDVLVQFVSVCAMEVAGTKTLSFEGKELREHDVFGCNP